MSKLHVPLYSDSDNSKAGNIVFSKSDGTEPNTERRFIILELEEPHRQILIDPRSWDDIVNFIGENKSDLTGG